MGPLFFLDVEGQTREAMLNKELPHFIGVIEGQVGQHRDVREWYAIILQQPDATHGAVMRAPAAPRDPVGIVNAPGTVNAHADLGIVSLEEVAPFLCDQCGVGLKLLKHPHAPGVVFRQHGGCAPVERDGDGERLAGMPEQGDLISQVTRREKALEDFGERLLADNLC